MDISLIQYADFLTGNDNFILSFPTT